MAGPILFDTQNGRTQRPSYGESLQIDWSNPLTDGLISCTFFTTGAGPPIDSVSGRFGTTIASLNWVEDSQGRVIFEGTTGDPSYALNNKELQNVKVPFSVMAFVEHPSTSANGIILQTSRTNGVKSGVRFQATDTSLLLLCCDAGGSSSSNNRRVGVWSGAQVEDAPVMYLLTCTEGGGTPVVADVYVDGVLSTVSNAPVNAGDAIAYSDTLTGHVGDPAEAGRGQWYAYAWWTRIVTPQEAADLAGNPYQLLVGPSGTPLGIGEPIAPVLPGLFENIGHTDKPRWGE